MTMIPLEKLLNSTTGGELAALLRQAEGRERLLSGLKAVLEPDLSARIRAVNLRPDGQLVIIAESPAWAARLRFAADALLAAARSAGAEASSCKVIVARDMPEAAGQDGSGTDQA